MTTKRKKSWREDVRLIQLYLKPRWAERDLSEIKRLDVERLHAEISVTKKIQANRVLKLAHCMFARACDWELLQKNPAHGVAPNKENVRQRIVESDEMPRLLAALEKEKPVWKTVFTLYLLLGCRKREILGIQWDNVSFERREVLITDTKPGKDLLLPLPDLALRLFSDLLRVGKYCFCVTGGRTHLVDGASGWRRVCRNAGLTNLHIHDLRRTFASHLASSGVNLTLIRDLLNHSSVKVTQIYTVVRNSNMRTVLEANSSRLLKSCATDIYRNE